MLQLTAQSVSHLAATADWVALASVRVGPVQFDQPHWLILLPILLALVIWIGRKSLSGLAGFSKIAALVVRVIVVILLVCTMADPQWRRESKDVAVTAILDSSLSVPTQLQGRVADFFEAAAKKRELETDRLGVVTVGRDALVQSLPSSRTDRIERTFPGAQDATNLAEAIKLGLAIRPRDAAYRLVLASDGLETVGSLLQAAQAAKALGVPIDVIPLQFSHDDEVVFDSLTAPATAREGETVNLRMFLTSTKASRGRINVLLNGEPIDLNGDDPGFGVPVTLQPGLNPFTQQVQVPRSGPQKFEAFFEPESQGGRPVGDALAQNNRAASVTFVSGEGRILVLGDNPDEFTPLKRALEESKLKVEQRPGDQLPATLTELNAYDAIILVNQPAFSFSNAQQENLKQYVHDSGGGLVMIGGPNTFGAGAWIGSPLEDALPVKLDPPSKRQMPKGALVLIIHSVEIPEGVYWGKRVSEAAVNALSRLDLIGINEFTGMGGTQWVYPLSPRGDGTLVKRAIQNLTFGDMPDFAPSFELTFQALSRSDAGQKHCIVISDGDPSHPGNAMLQKFVNAGITISTVGMATHGPGTVSNLQSISSFTRGKHYQVDPGAVGTLPQIFMKEAQTVRRSLIWEGAPFTPTYLGIPSEPMRGIGTPMPAISGYVVTAPREGLAQVILRGKEEDPILAQWQHGLGKTVVFTSDASTKWAASWVEWGQFRAFWEQHVRWAMRPGGAANVRVSTEKRGDETIIIADLLDKDGERLNFAQIRGRVALPDGTGQDVELRQIGPGRYEGAIKTQQSGSYVMSLRYAAPGKEEGDVMEGSIQASVSRPFADEFRLLEDNTALLEQVRVMTGGRTIGTNPDQADLFSRVGIEMPVSTRPIWLIVAILALSLFLVDVGVRRVRIDPALIAAAVRRAFKPGASKAGQQLGSLREAREKARRVIQERGSAESAGEGAIGGGSSSSSAGAGPDLAGVKSVKFEASAEQLRKPAKLNVVTADLTAEGNDRPAGAPTKPSSGAKGDPGDLGRLLKAKRKAQDDIEER
jgi:uncharacterized membrane protein